MKSYRIEVVIKPWKEGGYLAEVPALQGCWCVSDTVEAALDDIQEVITLAIQARRKVGQPLPPEIEEINPDKEQARLVLGVAVP
ncbi:MAG: type II toxin-antitoxin system HicB family antitoxin [Chloroflexi bacterium]|nr:type II toxin-antitoxin system HicB family antitoxin [Chloroflexota bacterium]